MQSLKIVQLLKETKRWMPLCAAILTAAAVAVSLVLIYTPREEGPPPEETEPAETAEVAASPRPTPVPEASPTAAPVITPPARSAASGSDVILTRVPLTSDSNLNAGPPPAPEAEPETGE